MEKALHLIYIVGIGVLVAQNGEARNENMQQISTIENYMDTSVNPCEDFYSYACGNWEAKHLQRDYDETIGYIDFKTDQNFARIFKKLMRTRSATTDREQFLQNVINYYKVCTTVENYNPLMYLRMLEQMEDIEFPAIEPLHQRRRANKKSYDWLRMLAVLRKYGLNGILLEETVILRKDDATKSIIDLDKPVLEGGFKPLNRYELISLLESVCVRSERDAGRNLLENIVNFESELERLSEIEDDEEGNRELQLTELKMPKLKKYLDTLMGRPMPGNTTVSVQNLPYLRKLFSTLEQYDSEDICRYLMFRFIWHLILVGPSNFLKIDCISHTRSMLPLAMSWLQQQNHATLEQDREIVGGIFAKLKKYFMATLEANSNNFNSKMVKIFQSKLNLMQLRLGNLPNETAIIREFYEDLQVNATLGSFYQNHLNVLHHYTAAQHKYLQKTLPIDGTFFHLENDDTGASSSPYYLMRQNIVFVPLGLLQRPIYHKQLMDVFLYSSIGFLLAHEITHGFDESGIEIDSLGSLLGPTQDISSSTRFNRSLNCLRGHQPEFIDEKIADINGLRVAYETFFSENELPEYPTPLELTDMPRLFFLNFAQFFCGSKKRAKFEHNEHGEDSERVLRTLSNFDQFGLVYSCPLGSRMNPHKKCQLW